MGRCWSWDCAYKWCRLRGSCWAVKLWRAAATVIHKLVGYGTVLWQRKGGIPDSLGMPLPLWGCRANHWWSSPHGRVSCSQTSSGGLERYPCPHITKNRCRSNKIPFCSKGCDGHGMGALDLVNAIAAEIPPWSFPSPDHHPIFTCVDGLSTTLSPGDIH